MRVVSTTQAGQALAEGVLVISALAALWMSVSWLYRTQDIALSAQHASSHLAFASARGDPNLTGRHHGFFSGPDNQWNSLTGVAMLADLSKDTGVDAVRLRTLPPGAQPGGTNPVAATLREDWHLEDAGVLDVRVHATSSMPPSTTDTTGRADVASPVALRRNTAILTFAGHASDDSYVQQVLARSGTAWGDGASTSYGLSRRIRAALEPVDAGWGRAGPEPEWLGAWSSNVPPAHLSATTLKE